LVKATLARFFTFSIGNEGTGLQKTSTGKADSGSGNSIKLDQAREKYVYLVVLHRRERVGPKKNILISLNKSCL